MCLKRSLELITKLNYRDRIGVVPFRASLSFDTESQDEVQDEPLSAQTPIRARLEAVVSQTGLRDRNHRVGVQSPTLT